MKQLKIFQSMVVFCEVLGIICKVQNNRQYFFLYGYQLDIIKYINSMKSIVDTFENGTIKNITKYGGIL
jgi:hypothetical protein